MKKFFLTVTLVVISCMSMFAQATSLTVDCQTPGWLSSKINYGDQLTLENIKVTGYINGTDIQFIYDLNSQRSLTGVIDLEDVSIVSGGTMNQYPFTVEKDNVMPASLFYNQTKPIQKFVYPKTLVEEALLPFQNVDMVDSLIWTSTNVKMLDIGNGIGYGKYVFLPEGIETVNQIPSNMRIVFPSSIEEVNRNGGGDHLIIYSFIENPETVYAQYEYYYSTQSSTHSSYWASITNSTFYIPKGTKERYLNSDFATMNAFYEVNGNLLGKANENVFIEYYDIENVIINSPSIMYKGESENLEVQIYPDANLVSWIDYLSSNTDIVSVDSEGKIVANDYGQAIVSATPHVFIDGLETKTGTCVVKVIAHTEGVSMPSTMNVHIGEEKATNAATLPLNVSDNQITYESSDPSIATVTADGIVKGIKSGNCIITATTVEGGYTAECVVTVLQPVEAVTLNKHYFGIRVGKTETLSAIVLPATAENKDIIWTSSDETIARVDDEGIVTGINDGVVWITATSEDNNEAFDKCEVVVSQSDSYVVSISTSNISTYCNIFPLDFSSLTRLKAYITSGFSPSTGEVLLTRVYKVPAGEGLVLKGNAGNYEVPYAETDMFYTNLLKGVTKATTISPTEGNYTNYILANGSHGIGFYTLSQTGEIAAGKAYLQLPTSVISNGARGIKMRFDDEESNPTAVSEVENQQPSESEYYDMQGRKVRNGAIRKGMYIMRNVNGSKQGAKVFIK